MSVPPGHASAIVHLLAEDQVRSYALAFSFRVVARPSGTEHELQGGKYRLASAVSLIEVIDRLFAGVAMFCIA